MYAKFPLQLKPVPLKSEVRSLAIFAVAAAFFMFDDCIVADVFAIAGLCLDSDCTLNAGSYSIYRRHLEMKNETINN